MADYELTVPFLGKIRMQGWSKPFVTALALAILIVGSARFFGFMEPHSASERAILARKLADAEAAKTEYFKHLGDTWVSIRKRGNRELFGTDTDDCLMERRPNGQRLIVSQPDEAPPLVAWDFESFEGIVYAANQGSRACAPHTNEVPAKREPWRDDGRWLVERWHFRDGCWAYASYDRSTGWWVLDFQGCRH